MLVLWRLQGSRNAPTHKKNALLQNQRIKLTSMTTNTKKLDNISTEYYALANIITILYYKELNTLFYYKGIAQRYIYI